MITNRNLNTSKGQDKKSRRKNYQQQIDNRNKNNGNFQTIKLYILCCSKCKSSLEHKAVYNYAMLYLIALIIIDSKILEHPENNETNPWPEHNPIALNRIMLNM